MITSSSHSQEQKSQARSARALSHCLYKEPLFCPVFYQQASRQRTGEGHTDQDQGEAGCQVLDHCLDPHEEKGAV